jgi:hypothetical protein
MVYLLLISILTAVKGGISPLDPKAPQRALCPGAARPRLTARAKPLVGGSGWTSREPAEHLHLWSGGTMYDPTSGRTRCSWN